MAIIALAKYYRYNSSTMHFRVKLVVAALTASINVILAGPLHSVDGVFPSGNDFVENCEIIETQFANEDLNSKRTGLINTMYRWPNNTVVYNMDSPPFEQSEIDLVERSLKAIEDVTCVKFVKRTDEDYFVNLTANSGCSSQVGYQKKIQNGPQLLNLNRQGCLYTGTIIHEFLHTLGFYHSQSAPNRDDYVTINWENIQKGKENNFVKYGANGVTDFDIEYDLLSIMHYGAFYFSANLEPTIVPHDSAFKELIGQRKGLSEKDIARINKMYNCN